uniref:Uncharacterized protein n=1 Tax=Klebsiella pneumoniae TaxID=573 RepID=A0A2P1BPS8_KLEPN|nr:hypothetical protein [Klebsiella pneumoniae]
MLARVGNIIEKLSKTASIDMKALLKKEHKITAGSQGQTCFSWSKRSRSWGVNEAVLVMRKEGLVHWKKISGYHRRSQAETAMYRFKQLMTGKISLRTYNGQVGK